MAMVDPEEFERVTDHETSAGERAMRSHGAMPSGGADQPDPTASDLDDRIGSLSPQRRALLDRLVRERRAAAADAIGPRPPDVPRLVSSAQRRMWFLDQYDPGGSTYVVYETVRIRGALARQPLERALQRIGQR